MFSKAIPSIRTATRLARPSPSSATTTLPSRSAAIASWRSYSASSGEAGKSTEGSDKAADGESEKVKALEAKLQDLEKDRKYKQAEIQTLSRRIEEERRKASEFAITKFARSLLSTSDVLTTALSHVPKPVELGTPLAALVNGVEMTQKALWKTFEQNGVTKMDISRGGAFDPNSHEATGQVPTAYAGKRDDGKEWGKGEVVEVATEGWMIAGRVLRPAQVMVTPTE